MDRRFLSRGRFYAAYVVLALLREAGFTILPAETGKGFFVVEAKDA